MGIPTFTFNIPQSGQSLGSTQASVNNNFGNYAGLVSVDHLGPNLSNQGQHNQVSLNTFASFPFTPAGSQSFLGSYSASSSGSQLVYQPSIVNYFIPATARSLARIYWTGTGTTWSLGNGPYGTGTNFNALTPTGITGGSCTYNFANVFPDTNYFVMVSLEGTSPAIAWGITNKTTSGFKISLNGSNATYNILIMVF